LYAPRSEGAVRWDDPAVAVGWPLDGITPTLSDKDAAAPLLVEMTAEFPYEEDPLGELEELTL